MFADLQHIAETQIQREQAAARHANRFLFCDTSPLTTLFYCRHLFGKVDPKLKELAKRTYAFTFLCAPDFPFVQDGTRQPETFRVKQHRWYLAQLRRRRIPFHLAVGSMECRIRQIRGLINGAGPYQPAG
jgi:nicotinamide riboside kinase